MRKSGLVPPTGLNIVARHEDVRPDADNRNAVVVHRRTHQRARSLRQVRQPCSGPDREVLVKKPMESWGEAMEEKRGKGLPEHHVVSGRMWSHGVPDILVNVRSVIQGLHCPALQQILVPVALFSQHSRQNVLWSGWNFHGHLPQPQGEPVMHLWKTPHWLTSIFSVTSWDPALVPMTRYLHGHTVKYVRQLSKIVGTNSLGVKSSSLYPVIFTDI